MPFKIISKYIASEFIRYYLLFLGSFVLMTLVGNFFGNLADIFTDWFSFLEFLQETALLLPLLLELITPITVLLATIATFSSMNKNAELLAMRSSGIGGWRLASPVLVVALLIAAFAYFSQNYMYTWMHQTWVKQENPNSLQPLWKVGEDQSIYFFGNRQQDGRLNSISSFYWKQNPFQLKARTRIEKGQQQNESWIFNNVQRYFFHDERLQLEHEEQWRVETEKLPTVPFVVPISPHHQPIIDLYQDTLKLQSEGQDVTRHWVEFFQKTAYPFQIFIMVLIGLGLSASYNRREVAAESLAISCLLGILFWILNQITMAVGGAGLILPFFASWSGNIIFFALALWLFSHNRV
ncbi:MAG: LptF/LptG family permease [SAR324 cluster bacterium]|nr:LptF/LptG family permease [SAR324 cluster bacterium]MBL7034383.1 LptF/LptG family permease [SAR324 cluster bacterium]